MRGNTAADEGIDAGLIRNSVDFGTGIHAIAGFGPPGKTFRRAMTEIAECGFRHLMLLCWEGGPAVDAEGDAPEAFINILASDLDRFRQTVAGHGLRVSAIYPGFGLFDLSDEGIEGTIERLLEYRRIAWQLGTNLMIHPNGPAEDPDAPHRDKRERIERLTHVMDAVSSDEPGRLFKMASDVHYRATVQTVEDCEYLLSCARNRNTGLCLNMGHQATCGQPGWELLERHPERIHVLAWKDHLLGPDLPQPVFSVELGKGETPFRKYLEVYRRVRCDALNIIAFEDVPFEEKKEALARSRQYLENLFAQEGA